MSIESLISKNPLLNSVYKDNLNAIVEKIESIKPLINSLVNYSIPLYLIEQLHNIEDLNTAFNRLNTEDVRMSQDELFFSGLKLVWPDSHNLVWEIYSDPETGRFLSPAEIIHLTARLAFAKMKNELDYKAEDLIKLSIDNFSKLIGFKDTSNSIYLKTNQNYLDKKDNNKSTMHLLLLKAKAALAYHPEKNSIGLPAPMLPKLKWRVWHTICAWIDSNQNIDISSESRYEMIRYALFDHFKFWSSGDDLIKFSFMYANSRSDTFPEKRIYQHF